MKNKLFQHNLRCKLLLEKILTPKLLKSRQWIRWISFNFLSTYLRYRMLAALEVNLREISATPLKMTVMKLWGVQLALSTQVTKIATHRAQYMKIETLLEQCSWKLKALTPIKLKTLRITEKRMVDCRVKVQDVLSFIINHQKEIIKVKENTLKSN